MGKFARGSNCLLASFQAGPSRRPHKRSVQHLLKQGGMANAAMHRDLLPLAENIRQTLSRRSEPRNIFARWRERQVADTLATLIALLEEMSNHDLAELRADERRDLLDIVVAVTNDASGHLSRHAHRRHPDEQLFVQTRVDQLREFAGVLEQKSLTLDRNDNLSHVLQVVTNPVHAAR